MAVTLDELRELKAELLKAQIRDTEAEIAFKTLKVAELARDENMASNMPSQNKVLHFFGPISRETVTKATVTLGTWANQSPGCGILILLNSEGGDIVAGFGFHDFLMHLRGRGHEITIKVVGGAMSMAVPILQAADHRIITPYSWLLVHEGKFYFDDPMTMKGSDMDQFKTIMNQYESKILDIVSAKATKPKSFFSRKWRNKEWMIDAEEALKLGLVDRIEA